MSSKRLSKNRGVQPPSYEQQEEKVSGRASSKRMSKGSGSKKKQHEMQMVQMDDDIESQRVDPYPEYPSSAGPSKQSNLGKAEWIEKMHKVQGVKWQLTPNFAIHRLRKMLTEGFTYGLPGTKGSVYMCLFMHFKQEHSLLAVYFGHPLHPFSRAERLLFLLICTCWIFFVSVETDQRLSEAWGVLATLILVQPFKKFVRLILECPCLYYKGYNFEHEVKDDEVDGEEQQFGARCAAAAAGHAVSAILFAGAIFLVVLSAYRSRGLNFDDMITKLVLSQVMSVTITEPLMMLAQSLFHLYIWPGEKKKFDDKWAVHFHHIGAPTPRSMSDVGLRAKLGYVEINGVTEFYRHFPDYDEWFHLGPSEKYIRSVEKSVIAQNGNAAENTVNPMIQEQQSSPAGRRVSAKNPYKGGARQSSIAWDSSPIEQEQGDHDYDEERAGGMSQALQVVDEDYNEEEEEYSPPPAPARQSVRRSKAPPPEEVATPALKRASRPVSAVMAKDSTLGEEDDLGARLSVKRKSKRDSAARPKSGKVTNLLA